ncbi:MAG: Do family serine endopeptidase [Candidatus Schekmanbacteria bacterium]|nr:MAG: Do family serine endopeptidase [Candidatus Schekmanbacteria bacterium]
MKLFTAKSGIATLFFYLLLCFVICYTPALRANEKKDALSFVEIAKEVKPSVVSIYTFSESISKGREKYHSDKNGNSLKDFFDKFRRKRPHSDKKNLGSGVIIDKDGYILTNNHIVEGSSTINVSLASGEEYKARIVGKDIKTDIALIKIDANRKLPAAKLGDSDLLQVGEWVMAIGNPYGLEETVTVGIVSAKGRVVGAGPYDNFIQTDSPINPGNSGGPLVNKRGEVVGINTLIFKGVQNLGFAIPINLAREVFQQLKERGRVVRGWLGVYIQKVLPEMVEFFKIDKPAGALVSEVTPNGPADKAGIKRGDIIINFDGVDIKDSNDLPLIVARRRVGKKVNVTVMRDGKKIVFPVVLGELKDELLIEESSEQEKGLNIFGMRIEYFTAKEANRMDIGEEEGLYVVDVYDSSQAEDKGIRRGDRILEVNKRQTNTISEFKKALKKNERGIALVLIKRGSNTFFVTLETE